MYALAEDPFPDKGADWGNSWRARQFEYTWLRTLTGHYADFWPVTEDALVYAAKLVKVELTVEKRNQLMQAFLNISAWPDALPTLQSLRSSGMKLALLSNFTPGNVRCSGPELRTARYFRTAPQYRQG